MPRQYRRIPPEARFWAKVEKTETCWLWTAALNDGGYGMFDRQRAHRFAFELMVGKIPVGLQIDHLCRVRRCVNPSHLEPVAQAENLARGEGIPAKRARQEECTYGHPFDETNTYRSREGRHCRTCAKLWQRVRRALFKSAGLTAHGKPPKRR